MAWMVENRGLSRAKSAALAGFLAWSLGIGSVLSFNLWQDIRLFDKTYFDIMDYVTSNLLLPLGGLLIAIFSVWLMSKNASVDELNMGEGIAYDSWRFLVRFIAPLAVIIIFLHAIDLI